MPAKATIAVEAFPCIDRFRGHGPLLQEPSFYRGRWMDQRTVAAAHGRESVCSGWGATIGAYSASGNHAESQNGYVPNVLANPARIGFLMT